jgi:hypothetical protein
VIRVAEFRQRSQMFVRSCLVEAHRDGLLAEGVGPEEAVVLVLGALLALAHAPPGLRPRAALPERVWGVLERVLRRPVRRATTRARLQAVPTRSRS